MEGGEKMSETMTGYGLAKLANKVRAELGLKPIPPQMVYNYLRAGLITGEKGSGQAPTQEQADAWLAKYAARLKERIS
jgi:hypothetical protein